MPKRRIKKLTDVKIRKEREEKALRVARKLAKKKIIDAAKSAPKKHKRGRTVPKSHNELFYILDGKTPIPCPDHVAWSEWYGNIDNSIIVQNTLDDIRVSTVFLGVDRNMSVQGPPLLFETMVFSNSEKYSHIQRRYSSFDEAVTGHNQIWFAIQSGREVD